MIEFALVTFFIFIPLMLGFVELGRGLYQHNMLNQSVAAGARYLGRVPGLVDESDCSYTTVKDTVEPVAQRLVVCGKTDSCSGELPVISGLSESDVRIGPSNYHSGVAAYPRSAGSVGGCVIRVEALATFTSIFGDFIPTPITLFASSEEKYIGK